MFIKLMIIKFFDEIETDTEVVSLLHKKMT